MSRQTDLHGEVIKATPAAVLFRDETGRECWLPRSVCLDGDAVDEGDTDLVVAEWFAAKEGLL